jgi:hypothetical protein
MKARAMSNLPPINTLFKSSKDLHSVCHLNEREEGEEGEGESRRGGGRAIKESPRFAKRGSRTAFEMKWLENFRSGLQVPGSEFRVPSSEFRVPIPDSGPFLIFFQIYINDVYQATLFVQKMKENGKSVASRIWKSEEEFLLVGEVFDLFDGPASGFESALHVFNLLIL